MMDDRVERLWSGGKLLLGPMVRASSLPLRLSSLDYGADVVYSEEIPAHRAGHATCIRMVNSVLQTVDFIEQKTSTNIPRVLFRTHVERECNPNCCVLQLGVSDAVSALRAAKLFERDVAAIDINMGCSKHYSVSRGMGSALMIKPAVAEDIIKTLRRNLSIPVSVKTRLQSSGCDDNMCQTDSSTSAMNNNLNTHGKVDTVATLEWVQRLQSAGAHAVTLHMRTPTEKNRDAAHYDMFALFHQAMRRTNTPLVYNGDVWDKADVLRISNLVGRSIDDSSNQKDPNVYQIPIMVSRAALWDPSIFALLKASSPSVVHTPVSELLNSIMQHSAATANCPLNTRYLLQQILAGAKQLSSPMRSEILRNHALMDLSVGLNCTDSIHAEFNRQTSAWEAYQNQHQKQQLCNDKHCVHNNDDSSAVTQVTEGNMFSVEQSMSKNSAVAAEPETGDDGESKIAVFCNDNPDAWTRFFNATDWPGVVCKTSHEYNDRYFDDNYYVAFNKPASVTQNSVKRPFAYAGFTESVVRTQKKKTIV